MKIKNLLIWHVSVFLIKKTLFFGRTCTWWGEIWNFFDFTAFFNYETFLQTYTENIIAWMKEIKIQITTKWHYWKHIWVCLLLIFSPFSFRKHKILCVVMCLSLSHEKAFLPSPFLLFCVCPNNTQHLKKGARRIEKLSFAST